MAREQLSEASTRDGKLREHGRERRDRPVTAGDKIGQRTPEGEDEKQKGIRGSMCGGASGQEDETEEAGRLTWLRLLPLALSWSIPIFARVVGRRDTSGSDLCTMRMLGKSVSKSSGEDRGRAPVGITLEHIRDAEASGASWWTAKLARSFPATRKWNIPTSMLLVEHVNQPDDDSASGWGTEVGIAEACTIDDHHGMIHPTSASTLNLIPSSPTVAVVKLKTAANRSTKPSPGPFHLYFSLPLLCRPSSTRASSHHLVLLWPRLAGRLVHYPGRSPLHVQPPRSPCATVSLYAAIWLSPSGFYCILLSHSSRPRVSLIHHCRLALTVSRYPLAISLSVPVISFHAVLADLRAM
ncbi:hypothetical protein C8T65DRAFT_702784 [Cerioporus squamosus]|nr:hypothetical protein C8T65DRAFT_702784 [Cerioporus squamosus]